MTTTDEIDADVESRAREMLADLIGLRYSDTTLRVATDWLKQERRLTSSAIAAAPGPGEIEKNDLSPDFTCMFDDDDYAIALPSGHGVTVCRDGKIIVTVSKVDAASKPVSTSVSAILASTPARRVNLEAVERVCAEIDAYGESIGMEIPSDTHLAIMICCFGAEISAELTLGDLRACLTSTNPSDGHGEAVALADKLRPWSEYSFHEMHQQTARDLFKQAADMIERLSFLDRTDKSEDVEKPLTSNFANAFPDGSRDECSYGDIEDALDLADAPSLVDGKWLTLPERIAAIASKGGLVNE